MKISMFHLMPYRDLPDDFEKRYHSVWVDPPFWDLTTPEKAGLYYNQTLDELIFAAKAGMDGVCVNEHHQNAYGNMPGPNLMGSVLARATAGMSDMSDAQMDMQIQIMWSAACTGKFVWPIPDKGLKKRIHRIRAPTLIIWGRQDGIVPPRLRGRVRQPHRQRPCRADRQRRPPPADGAARRSLETRLRFSRALKNAPKSIRPRDQGSVKNHSEAKLAPFVAHVCYLIENARVRRRPDARVHDHALRPRSRP